MSPVSTVVETLLAQVLVLRVEMLRVLKVTWQSLVLTRARIECRLANGGRIVILYVLQLVLPSMKVTPRINVTVLRRPTPTP